MSRPSAPPLSVESLQVRRDRVAATVRVRDAAWRETTPQLARIALSSRPDLAIHSCVNGVGPVFGAVLPRTPLPHLLEHVVIDLQTAACADPDKVFTGATCWTDCKRGLARVEVSYADDLVAIRAFRDAAALVNAWVADAGGASAGASTASVANRPFDADSE